jgi:hypothetical protein
MNDSSSPRLSRSVPGESVIHRRRMRPALARLLAVVAWLRRRVHPAPPPRWRELYPGALASWRDLDEQDLADERSRRRQQQRRRSSWIHDRRARWRW